MKETISIIKTFFIAFLFGVIGHLGKGWSMTFSEATAPIFVTSCILCLIAVIIGVVEISEVQG
jgi:hypothetical protein